LVTVPARTQDGPFGTKIFYIPNGPWLLPPGPASCQPGLPKRAS